MSCFGRASIRSGFHQSLRLGRGAIGERTRARGMADHRGNARVRLLRRVRPLDEGHASGGPLAAGRDAAPDRIPGKSGGELMGASPPAKWSVASPLILRRDELRGGGFLTVGGGLVGCSMRRGSGGGNRGRNRGGNGRKRVGHRIGQGRTGRAWPTSPRCGPGFGCSRRSSSGPRTSRPGPRRFGQLLAIEEQRDHAQEQQRPAAEIEDSRGNAIGGIRRIAATAVKDVPT